MLGKLSLEVDLILLIHKKEKVNTEFWTKNTNIEHKSINMMIFIYTLVK